MWEKQRTGEVIQARVNGLSLRACRPANTGQRQSILALAAGLSLHAFDLIPDFIPVLGYLDDGLIVPALVYAAVRLVPQELVAEHRANVLADHAR